MRIEEVQLRNFGPYFGEHRVELGTTASAPVIVLHGENTWGKTSFINAIKWCLYGRVRGIDRRDKALWRLVNRDAFRSGERLMSVKMLFTHGGKPFQLERQAAFSESPGPTTHFSQKAVLVEDGNFVDEARIRDRISGILDEDISRFFLFDAEMLEEFERLVESADGPAAMVKHQIEQALGLPALRFAQEDLAELQNLTARKQFKAIRATKRGAEVAAEARQADDELQSLGRNINDLIAQRNELEQKRDALRERRAQFAEIQAAASELDDVEQSIRAFSDEISRLERELREQLSTSWWLPLSATLRADVEAMTVIVEEASASSRLAQNVGAQVSALLVTIAQERCAVCGQEISGERHAELDHQLKDLQKKQEGLRNKPEEFEIANRKLVALIPFFSGADLASFREKEIRLRGLRLDRRTAERKQRRIEEQIGAHDREDIRATERAYEEAVVELAGINVAISKAETRREEFQSLLTRLKREAERIPGANPRVATEVALYEALQTVFARGIEDFRERMRADVEKEASTIFKSLTTESQFSGLRINEGYGLTILDSHGEPMPDKSAGAAQTIALALVGALNRSALREAPVIVDTPLGRLDLGHRANVLKFFPSMGEQVMFMPHTGEFDRKLHLPILEGSVSRELKIVRENLRSRIVPFSG